MNTVLKILGCFFIAIGFGLVQVYPSVSAGLISLGIFFLCDWIESLLKNRGGG